MIFELGKQPEIPLDYSGKRTKVLRQMIIALLATRLGFLVSVLFPLCVLFNHFEPIDLVVWPGEKSVEGYMG
jgi:hypothetical protein